MGWLTLGLLTAGAQEPVTAGSQDATVPDAARLVEPAPDADAQDDPGVEPQEPQEPFEATAPEPWSPPEDPALRAVDGQPMLGPWPDDHTAEAPVQRAWPVIDVRTGEVLHAGHPYGQGAGTLGPVPAPVVLPAAPVAPSAPEPEGPAVVANPRSAPPPPAAALPGSVAPAALWVGLPQAPPHSAVLALFWAVIGLGSALFARSAPSLVDGLGGAGALSLVLRTGGLAGRALAVIAGALAVLYALPDGARSLVPWLLLGLALSAGLASWGLLRDVVAMVVLGLERRLVPGRHVRIGDVSGQVVGLSPRAVTLTTRSGSEIAVPNWSFLSQSVQLDDDPRMRAEVRLHVPAGAPRERVHRVLEELVLLSPYAVSRGRPVVRPDPDDPTAWWVEARLLDARWAQDFERTLVELANERLEH